MHICTAFNVLTYKFLNACFSFRPTGITLKNMDKSYKIRLAKDTDKEKIHSLIRESIAREKMLSNPLQVPAGFMEEFVDKVIRKEKMLVVENSMEEMELIGEIHDYSVSGKKDNDIKLREFIFYSRMDRDKRESETKLVNWLYGEIQKKHSDVFRVELNAPFSNPDSVDHFRKMGLRVEGQYERRLSRSSGSVNLVIPLSWSNPSFN